MTKVKKLKVPIVIISIIFLIIAGIKVYKFKTDIEYKARKPQGSKSSNFLYQESFYSCSKDIEGEWREAWVGNPGGRGYYFYPANDNEFRQFCRTTAVIEYRAVIDILKRPDVATIIAKYDTTQAWVRALGHKYIGDKEYLQRILPSYNSVQIDCIIVVHSPEGTRFFIENGEVHNSHTDHKYIEIPAKEFLSSLNNAPDEDVNEFWLALH